LKVGGFLAVYVPNITQMREFVLELGENYFTEKIIENIQREWHVDERRCRPVTKDHAHTAFLGFFRKLK
jgi:tRNA A58 N-methylase Trm61